jgi:hypothetical protein
MLSFHRKTSQAPTCRALRLSLGWYAVRDDLRAYNKRLLEYVSNGGNLVVQYNRGNELGNLQIGPYPFTAPNVNDNNKDRVTKEDAPVKLLNPDHPLLSIPNKITEADFDGWVDERGTFFLQKWDPKYTALLESHDPGEDPRQGGLVVTKYGKGSYIYAGYLFPPAARRRQRGLQAFCQSCVPRTNEGNSQSDWLVSHLGKNWETTSLHWEFPCWANSKRLLWC